METEDTPTEGGAATGFKTFKGKIPTHVHEQLKAIATADRRTILATIAVLIEDEYNRRQKNDG